jgi:serine/threonine protein kinase
MALSARSRLGAYEIIAPIGRRGMGEVYRAHDTRLARDVALKYWRTPRRLTWNSAHVSLNHPNIAAIYGFAENGSAGSSAATDGNRHGAA